MKREEQTIRTDKSNICVIKNVRGEKHNWKAKGKRLSLLLRGSRQRESSTKQVGDKQKMIRCTISVLLSKCQLWSTLKDYIQSTLVKINKINKYINKKRTGQIRNSKLTPEEESRNLGERDTVR